MSNVSQLALSLTRKRGGRRVVGSDLAASRNASLCHGHSRRGHARWRRTRSRGPRDGAGRRLCDRLACAAGDARVGARGRRAARVSLVRGHAPPPPPPPPPPSVVLCTFAGLQAIDIDTAFLERCIL